MQEEENDDFLAQEESTDLLGEKSMSSQAVESRMARKRAEEDERLLHNRIMLLKLEEKKVKQY
jgi:hypothetical protein